jgi:hypothetical protein
MGTDADKALNYRQRAERIRVIADRIANPDTREAMLQMAEDFERLAETIEMTVGVLPPEAKGP